MNLSARRQPGQVIVLFALAVVVLIGVLGLALDGGRVYVDRRSMQGAVDAAALAAANNYIDSQDGRASDAVGATAFATNERLYPVGSCGAPSAGLTLTCTYTSDAGMQFQITGTDHSIAGMEFTATSTHTIPSTVMAVLGIPSMTIHATATAVARRPSANGAAILTLSPHSCDGTGNGNSSLTFGGSTYSVLAGDVWSNGSINNNGNRYAAYVAGNVVDICTTPPIPGITLCTTASTDCPAFPSPYPPLSAEEVNGWAQPDPDYPEPAIDTTSRTWTTSSVLLSPGKYAGMSSGTIKGCYFLTPGVYDMDQGITANGGFISNELRPPDEALISGTAPYTGRASPQFWDENGVHCSGSFLPSAIADSTTPAPAGTYGVEVTAARFEPGSCSVPSATCYLRESVPSRCQPVTLSTGQSLRVDISNVPGAAFYNVYASAPGAAGTGCSAGQGFALVGSIANTVNEQWRSNDSCPSALPQPATPTCGLGVVSGTFTGAPAQFGTTWAPPYPSAQPGTRGAAPPQQSPGQIPNPSGTPLPNQTPGTASSPNGDRANENYCIVVDPDWARDGLPPQGTQYPCPTADYPNSKQIVTTPGAVVFFVPGPGSNQQCFNLQGGVDTYAFSGFQYHRVVVYEPGPLQAPPPNSCANNVQGHGFTSFIGVFYLPAASVTITGNSGYAATIAGGVVAYSATITGNGSVSITADPNIHLWPKTIRLTH